MKIILNEYLQSVGKTQYWLAKETGIAASTLSRLCSNQTSSIEFETIDKICSALNCQSNDIFQSTKIITPLQFIKKAIFKYRL